MTDDYLQAFAYANERAREFSAKPIVLVITTAYLTSPLKPDLAVGHYLAKRLNRGSFSAIRAIAPKGRLDKAAWDYIEGVKHVAKSNTREANERTIDGFVTDLMFD